LEKKSKKTLVIGASPRPYRYAYTAVQLLQSHGHPVTALGLREGNIGTIKIETGFPEIDNVHTVVLYIGRDKQDQYYDYLLHTIKPSRIIFNPGTENKDFYAEAKNCGIEVIENCTLMMLSNGVY